MLDTRIPLPPVEDGWRCTGYLSACGARRAPGRGFCVRCLMDIEAAEMTAAEQPCRRRCSPSAADVRRLHARLSLPRRVAKASGWGICATPVLALLMPNADPLPMMWLLIIFAAIGGIALCFSAGDAAPSRKRDGATTGSRRRRHTR